MRLIHQYIEQKRAELNRLAEKYGLSDSRVLVRSQELDRLLNKYQQNKDSDKRKKKGGPSRCEEGISWRFLVCNEQ